MREKRESVILIEKEADQATTERKEIKAMKNRILSALGAAVLILSLTACQSGPGEPSVPAEPSSVPSRESPGGEEPLPPREPSAPNSREDAEASAPEPVPDASSQPEAPVQAAPPAETYFPGDVQSIYALDVDAYLMAPVEDGYPESKAIWEGLKDRSHSGGEPSGYAFVIFTEEDKEYIYLDDSQEDTALNKYCQAALRDEFLHPSWLIHMTPERMVSANGITDRDELLALAKVLKEVTVGEETSVHDGPENPDMPAGLVFLRITFDSGVEYTLIGYVDGEGNGPFSIHTSDLDKTVTYQSMNGSLGKIKTFLEKQR